MQQIVIIWHYINKLHSHSQMFWDSLLYDNTFTKTNRWNNFAISIQNVIQLEHSTYIQMVFSPLFIFKIRQKFYCFLFAS